MKRSYLLIALTAILSFSCQGPELTVSGLDSQDFTFSEDGKSTALFTIHNHNGMEVCLTNYGGRIVSVMVPDRKGGLRDVVLGFDNIHDYMNISNNFGATIGRYGNRIDHGRITIDGTVYQLPQNNYGHCLHGGPEGWDHKIMDVRDISDSSLTFTLTSPDGEAGFPGNVEASVKMTVTDQNELKLEYTARTDKKTVINMTNHSYFNLSGTPDEGVLDHIMYVNADGYTPIDNTFMTSGDIESVSGTPMDFRVPKQIGKDINDDFEQLKNGRGYDHNWVLNTKGSLKEPAATLYSEKSGIKMTVFTDEPGIQIYSGNFLNGEINGKKGMKYIHRASICMETQHYPDSPNKTEWPSVIVEPGQTYTSTCIYKFTVEKQ